MVARCALSAGARTSVAHLSLGSLAALEVVFGHPIAKPVAPRLARGRGTIGAIMHLSWFEVEQFGFAFGLALAALTACTFVGEVEQFGFAFGINGAVPAPFDIGNADSLEHDFAERLVIGLAAVAWILGACDPAADSIEGDLCLAPAPGAVDAQAPLYVERLLDPRGHLVRLIVLVKTGLSDWGGHVDVYLFVYYEQWGTKRCCSAVNGIQL